MDCVIIYKKDLVRFGKKIMKDFYTLLHDEYMLTYKDVKKSREIWDKYLVEKFKDFIRIKNLILVLDIIIIYHIKIYIICLMKIY